MKSMLFRTGSGPIPVQLPTAHSSPRLSVDFSSSLHAAEVSRRSSTLRRSSSEPNIMIRSEIMRVSSRSFITPRIPEVDGDINMGSPGAGGGMNKNRNSGKGGQGSGAERNDVGAYYLEMIKSDPTNSLILTNYATYLHQVEGDLVRAEEYYGRAILASPESDDGQLLSLFGKLIWDSHRDQTRAKSYFTQAIQASPNDCMVLGSYAHFLWEADQEEEEDDEEAAVAISAMVEAF